MCKRVGMYHLQIFVVTNFWSSFCLENFRGSSNLAVIWVTREPENRRAGRDASPHLPSELQGADTASLESVIISVPLHSLHSHLIFPGLCLPLLLPSSGTLFWNLQQNPQKYPPKTSPRRTPSWIRLLTKHKEGRAAKLTCETVLSLSKMHDQKALFGRPHTSPAWALGPGQVGEESTGLGLFRIRGMACCAEAGTRRNDIHSSSGYTLLSGRQGS